MSFNNNEFVLNHKTNRLIKRGGALHRTLLKESLREKDNKKKPYAVQTDTESEAEPVKRTRKQAPKKIIGKKNLKSKFDNIDNMTDSEMSEMELYITRKLNKTKIVEPTETDIPESSESSESSE
jgi:hypothetical protein